MVEVHNSVPVTILVGIGLLFVSLSLTFVIILRKRYLTKTVKICVISEGGSITRQRMKTKDIKKTVKINKLTYIYDKKLEVDSKFGKEIYYMENNPLPIDIRTKEQDTNLNSENLTAIIETELIAKLFKKEQFSTENILIFVAIITSAIGLILVFMMFNGGVKLKATPENIEVLRQALTQALATGV